MLDGYFVLVRKSRIASRSGDTFVPFPQLPTLFSLVS
jgi:hypothetical protein